MLKLFFNKQPEPSKTGFEFKMLHSFDKRKEESTHILNKYPDRIPVIVEKSDSSPTLKDIDKHKYLIPRDLTIGQFIHLIRQRIKIDAKDSIFIFIDNRVIPKTSDTIGQVYEQNQDKDGFLYVSYSAQQTFGH